ncbi:Retrovirus-related Pol polyprotein from transposon TNT 1-94 [Senna tora]|uniref:Retrovirus-related Pol polyprotein from transposon TNT 1-94 n=1 Tax=Senna tora TaxID=362788 RepID=A0A834W925_9FABA|nr:Retrovirus-related Pol polyprotein from transposon TNT 1-94 [Senna tora]
MALSLLAHASLPLKFWDEAVLTSVYLINRLPTPVLCTSTPLQVLSVIFDETSLPFKTSKSSSFVSPESVSSSLSLPLVLTPIDSSITRTQNLPNINVQTNVLDGEHRVSSAGTFAVVVPSSELVAVVHNSETSPSELVAEMSTEPVAEVPTVVNRHSMVTRSKVAKCDHSLFIKFFGKLVLFVLVYVDDVIVTGNSVEAIMNFVKTLNSKFSLKDLGPLHYFLGIQAQSLSDGGLLLTQTKYIKDLLLKVEMAGASPQKTPLTSSLRLSFHGSEVFEDPQKYRSVVGALQYVTITRPDLSFSVNKVCQFMHEPKLVHWQAVKKILRRFSEARIHGKGIIYQMDNHNYILKSQKYLVDPSDTCQGYSLSIMRLKVGRKKGRYVRERMRQPSPDKHIYKKLNTKGHQVSLYKFLDS